MLGCLAASAFATASPSWGRSELAAERLGKSRRGFNLPGIGDTPLAENRKITPAALAALRRLGFDTIRLPIEPALLGADAAQRSVFLSSLDLFVEQLMVANFTVTLDMHAGPKVADILRQDPDQGTAIVMEAWRQLLSLSKGWPSDGVMLEMLNEPALPAERWPDLRQRLVDTIRQKTTSHTLVWGAANYQTIEETMADKGPQDGNAIAAVHYYYPMIFTHQGQDWVDGPLKAVHGFPFPSSKSSAAVRDVKRKMELAGHTDAVELIDKETAIDWTQDRIRHDMLRLKDWATSAGWPVTINEFGVYRSGAPRADRARWLKTVRTSAEDCGFGWAHWEIDQGFGFMTDRNSPSTIDPAIRDALLGGRS